MPTARIDAHVDASLTVRLLVREPHFIDRDGVRSGGRLLALLTALLMSRRALTRDELLDLLWRPDASGPDPHHRLRELLFRLKDRVPRQLIRIDGAHTEIELSRVRCDAIDFQTCLATGNVDAAIELYEADFFSRGTPRDAPGFEEWANSIRGELRAAFRAALRAEAETSARALPERYVKIADRLWQLDPNDAAGAEHLLRASLAIDDPSKIAEAERALTLALDSAGIRPGTEAQQLLGLAEARRREPSPPAPTPFDPPFTGRSVEIARIRRALDTLRRGGSGAVIGISGQSGVGKTRLLAEIERLARIDGMWVLNGRAYEVDWRTPYAAIADTIGPFVGDIPNRFVRPGILEKLATILPDLGPGTAETDSRKTSPGSLQIHQTIAGLLDNVARERPVVVIVDDAHWSDEQSRACLHRIGLRTANASILLVVAYRDSHERVVAPLFSAASVELCRIQPFTRDEVNQLLLSLAGFADESRRERLVRSMLASSGGNPLQLIQHLNYLRETGMISVRDGLWEMHGPLSDDSAAVIEPVVALIARRLEALSDAERNVLAACAVLERTASRGEVATVAGVAGARIADQLDVLIRQRLVQTESDRVALAHIEIGNAALRSIHKHRLEEMFEAALSLAESHATARTSGSSLARLRLACGAGRMHESRVALLETLRDAVTDKPERLIGVADEVLLAARDWCSSPAFFAELDRESRTALANPSRMDKEIRVLRRRLTKRNGPFRNQNLISAALLAVAILAGVFLRSDPRLGDLAPFGGGGLLLLRDSTGATRAVRIAGPGPVDTIPAEYQGSRLFGRERRLLSPDGRHRLLACQSGDRQDRDVCIETMDGTERRVLVSRPGEDGPQGWSPDGNSVLISSYRSDTSGYKDVFVVRLADSTRLDLTRAAPRGGDASWSPDGTRIAYKILAPAGDTLIVSNTRGDRQIVLGATGTLGDYRWSTDGTRLAFTRVVRENGPSTVWLLDVRQATPWRVESSNRVLSPVWSPDGRYVILTESLDHRRRTVNARVFQLQDSSALLVGTYRDAEVLEWLHERRPTYLDRLIVPDSLTFFQGETLRVPVRGTSAHGQPVEVMSLDLTVRDSGVVQALGGDSIYAVAPGRTMAVLSAGGGWRTTRMPVTVVPPPAPNVLFEEDWSFGIDTLHWKYFGTPWPTVVDRGSRRAMRNNGDNNYPSGIVTRQVFALSRGLAVEWTQSTPLTGDFWQEIWISALPAELDEFVEGPGDPFPLNRALLSAQTPLLDSHAAPIANFGCSGVSNFFRPFDETFRRNAEDHVLVQAYPSGGCDLYVNGTLRARLRPEGKRPWTDSVRIALGGRSHRADILISGLQVTEGIVTRPTTRER
jgi:DNA-binding SARP family transcriptional activator